MLIHKIHYLICKNGSSDKSYLIVENPDTGYWLSSWGKTGRPSLGSRVLGDTKQAESMLKSKLEGGYKEVPISTPLDTAHTSVSADLRFRLESVEPKAFSGHTTSGRSSGKTTAVKEGIAGSISILNRLKEYVVLNEYDTAVNELVNKIAQCTDISDALKVFAKDPLYKLFSDNEIYSFAMSLNTMLLVGKNPIKSYLQQITPVIISEVGIKPDMHEFLRKMYKANTYSIKQIGLLKFQCEMINSSYQETLDPVIFPVGESSATDRSIIG